MKRDSSVIKAKHGGARVGAGKKAKVEEYSTFSLRIPKVIKLDLELIVSMLNASLKENDVKASHVSVNSYIVSLIEKDVSKKKRSNL